MATSSVVVVGLVVSYVYGEMRCEKTADARWHILKNPINAELQCCGSAVLVIKPFIFFCVILRRFFFLQPTIILCGTKSWITTLVMHAGPMKRDDIPEGLLWWDLNKKDNSEGQTVCSELYVSTSPVSQRSALIIIQNGPVCRWK